MDDLIEREPVAIDIERDIRIAIWNACCWQGKPQAVAQSFIGRVMEESTMTRAIARIAALEADKARLMGLVGEVAEGFSGPTAWLERWATHVGNCQGGAICECGLTLASLESATTLAKLKEATDGRVTD